MLTARSSAASSTAAAITSSATSTEASREILAGPRARRLRELVLSTPDSYCRAIGQPCPLKTIPAVAGDDVPTPLRFLAIEPTTACDLRCLTCPVRDCLRRRRLVDRPGVTEAPRSRCGMERAASSSTPPTPLGASAPAAFADPGSSAAGTGAHVRCAAASRPAGAAPCPLEVIKRVLTDAATRAGAHRHVQLRRALPLPPPRRTLSATRAGSRPRPPSRSRRTACRCRPRSRRQSSPSSCSTGSSSRSTGSDAESYRRYRIRGRLRRRVREPRPLPAERGRDRGCDVIWQYVVFAWNDSTPSSGARSAWPRSTAFELQFDFAHTWGRSRRPPRCRPLPDALPAGRTRRFPGEARQERLVTRVAEPRYRNAVAIAQPRISAQGQISIPAAVGDGVGRAPAPAVVPDGRRDRTRERARTSRPTTSMRPCSRGRHADGAARS